MDHFDWLKGVVFPYANFTLFLVSLVYLARKPAAAFAKKRSESYQEVYLKAKKEKEDADKANKKLRMRFEALSQELQALRESALKSTEEEVERIMAAGQKVAEHIKEEAKRSAAVEAEEAQEKLRQEVWQTTSQLLAQKVKSNFGENDQNMYIRRGVAKLGELNVN
tara:strand:- start:685 stop:1182 length:498 start_codon:yes stop_codon:yes gene_type:complete